MQDSFGKLTVYFETPFWVGVFEICENSKLSAIKITFGAEPKDNEIYAFVLNNYTRLKFSPQVEIYLKKETQNPKRLKRKIQNELKRTTFSGTKSQQALKKMQEQTKLQKREKVKRERQKEQQFRYEQRKQLRKSKHKGK